MQCPSDFERFVLCSGGIVLACGKCGEKLILLGFEDDWHSEEHTIFECECGERLSLTSRGAEKSLTIRNSTKRQHRRFLQLDMQDKPQRR
jgi:hypothetical protein